jgi:hypothetical protein
VEDSAAPVLYVDFLKELILWRGCADTAIPPDR